ncbi:MAG: response regulator transcription factor [Burkholderiales bacterium]
MEDDAESINILQEVLADQRLFFARNAFEGLRQINTEFFHGYVLDYWLSDWSGPALCREMRKSNPYAPIVFCTAPARDSDRTRAMRAGANAYLCKPLDADVLRSKLRAFLTLAEMESLRAKVEEERAVQDELEPRLRDAHSRIEVAKELVASSIERTARNKAYKAFIHARDAGRISRAGGLTSSKALAQTEHPVAIPDTHLPCFGAEVFESVWNPLRQN